MRILVWLSWWVDSAVAAYLLQQNGHEVIAWFMKNYANPENPHCQTRKDRNMAIKVAHHLWIDTFMIFDFRTEYHERIISYIYDWYQSWITPNPDVLCNSLIKFDLFLEKWVSFWCDAIATWHYARIEKKENTYHLLKGIDQNKDQSYFLSWLTQEQLSRSIFPLGWYTKKEIREIAKKISLPNAERKDSQWLCFIGKVPIKQFLSKALPKKTGNIIDTTWDILGEHDWAHFVTIGQRTWLWLSWWPWYVISKDTQTNTIIVSKEQELDLYHKNCRASNREWKLPNVSIKTYNWKNISAKIRYRQEDQPCRLSQEWWSSNMNIHFLAPQRAISPGQVVVLYHWDELIWQWIITSWYN